MPAVARRIAAPLLLAALLAAPSSAAAQPRCQFATGGDGLAVTIAMRGTAGLRLRVDWGDGTVETVRRLDEARERGYIRHEYAAAGRYTVTAEARDPAGGGCRLEATLDVPYPMPDDEDSLAVLPPAGAGPDEPDVEEPPAREQAPASVPTIAPREPPAGGGGPLQEIGRTIRGWLGSLFGGR